MTKYAVFPMSHMDITQGMGVGTHINSFAIDNAGANPGIDSVFAPFDGVIKKIWSNGNSVWLESLEPVEWANGTVDFLTVMFTHDNDVSNLSVGQRINQGVNFYAEGTAGNASGNHVHIGVGAGKFSGTGWHQNAGGYWVINNEVKPYDAFYLSGTEVINNAGYPWVEREQMTAITRDQVLWHYRLISGNEPSEIELNAYTGTDYVKTTEEIKRFFANSGQGYNEYKKKSEAKISELEKQVNGEYKPAGEIFVKVAKK